MSNKKIVIFGAEGMLGRVLANILSADGNEVRAWGRRDFDLLNEFSGIDEKIKGSDFVFNAAVIGAQQSANIPDSVIFRVNSEFPQELARRCSSIGALLIQISTDAVFAPGQGPCIESSPTMALDNYGRSKRDAEAPSALSIRTSIVGEDPRMSRGLLEWVRSKRGQSLKGFTNHLWNGMTTVELSRRLNLLLRDQNLCRPGVMHFFSEPAVNKNDLIVTINDIYSFGCHVEPTEAPQSVTRTLQSERPHTFNVCKKPLAQQLAELREFHLKSEYQSLKA